MPMTQNKSRSAIPGTPEFVGKYNPAMDGATRRGDRWWEGNAEGPQSVKVDLDADAPLDKKGRPKKLKAERGCGIISFAILLRVLGFAAGFAMVALGGWILYRIAGAKTASQMVQFAAFGVFLCLCGLLSVLVETRTKRTMRGCLATYVIVSSYLSRGFFYLAIGALTFAVKDFPFPPPYVKIMWIAAGMLGIGGLNLIFYPFYWGYLRRDSAIRENPLKIGNAEEVIYDMDIYNPEKKKAMYAQKQKEADESNPEHVAIPIAADGPSH